MAKILIKNATIINENKSFTGSVLINGEYIEKVIENAEMADYEKNCTVVDAAGKLLIPGVIDDQVHFREPGLTHKGRNFSCISKYIF